MDYRDRTKTLKDLLNSLLTADNTDTITRAVSELDELEKIHESDETEKLHLKDRIVDIVKNTSFKEENKVSESKLVEEPKDIDTALSENLAQIIKNRR